MEKKKTNTCSNIVSGTGMVPCDIKVYAGKKMYSPNDAWWQKELEKRKLCEEKQKADKNYKP